MKKPYELQLQKLLKNARSVPLTKESRVVILSDLHMGDNGLRDDSRINMPFINHVIQEYYFKKDYRLILNGDIEELQRFNWQRIQKRQPEFYRIARQFAAKNALIKLAGNHDIELLEKDALPGFPVHEKAVVLDFAGQKMLVFHGHQASKLPNWLFRMGSVVLRLLSRPLHIPNYSVAYDNRKKYRIEKRAYQFAKTNKIIAIIGHTHRPLFESLSKTDTLKFKIEQYCRQYTMTVGEERNIQADKIKLYSKELQNAHGKPDSGSLYTSEPSIPCLFNSGCGIGHSGFTTIEINAGRIALVHWFDRNRATKYFNYNGVQPVQFGQSNYYRVELKSECLDYVFTRINLLS